MSALLRGASILLLARAAVPGTSFLIVYALAWFGGVEPVGELNTAMTALGVFQIFVGLGLDNYIVREVVKDPARARMLIHATIRRVMPIAVAATAATTFAAWAAGYQSAVVQAVATGSPCLPAIVAATIYEAAFIALGRASVVAFATSIESTVRIALSLAVILVRPDVRLLLAAHALSKAITVLAFAIAAARSLPATTAASSSPPGEFWKRMTPFVGILAVYSLLWRADLLIVARLCSAYDTGIYSMAQKLAMVFFLVPASIVMASLPRLTESASRDPDAFRRHFNRTLSVIALYTTPVAIVTALRSDDMIALLGLQTKFGGAAPALSVLIFMLPLMSITDLASRALQSTGFERVAFAIGLRSLAVAVLSVGIAAHYAGAYAAAWAIVAAAAVDVAQNLWSIRRQAPSSSRQVARILIEGTMLLGVLLPVSGLPLPAFLALAAGSHIGLSFICGLIAPRDMRAALSAFRPS